MAEPASRRRVDSLSSSARVDRFCIVATPRTGSNFLCGVLEGVPGVICHYELFNPLGTFVDHRLTADVPPSVEDRDADHLAFLSFVEQLTTNRFPETRAIGFKLFVSHSEAVLDHVLAAPAYRIVVLARANKLAQYSSALIATRAGRWKTLEGES